MYINKDFSLVFFRFIDGQVYDGVVKGKEKALQQYTEAVSRGQSAGIVRYVDQWISLLPGLIQVVFISYFVEEPCVSSGIKEKTKEKIICCTKLCLFLSDFSQMFAFYLATLTSSGL